jgi:5-methylcytosine-specific restriction endonuclease McrA
MKFGSKATKEHKMRISESLKRAYLNGKVSPMKGKKHSQETRQKMSIAISKALTGKKQTLEHKLHNSIAHKGMHNSPKTEFKKGVKKSQEWKQMMRDKFLGNKSPRWKGGYENKLWHNRKRRVMKLGSGGQHTQEEWELLKVQYDLTCPSCGLKEPIIKLSVDHIIPLTKGGSDNIENIQPLCRSCNSSKNNKIIKYA